MSISVSVEKQILHALKHRGKSHQDVYKEGREKEGKIRKEFERRGVNG